tara:strand:- start:1349 stop:1858 length:510 start_codon:yes stop_codon:yes gene_type:complete
MGLLQVATNTVTSAVANVTLTGINTDDVYMLTYMNMQGSVNDKYPQFRLTESGTANETSNYDYAAKKLKTYSSFQTVAQTDSNLARLTDEKLGDQAQETGNGFLYIYNANNSSEYTSWSMENVNRDGGGNLMSMTGGGVFTVTSAVDGIYLFIDASNIVSGTFTLYKVV